MSFPKGFIWGAASAAAQIEGAWDEDGRTASVWDTMPPGKIHNNETCHIACDHYHRWREDVKLMASLGLQAYRFSVSWSRVIPEKGKVNPAGLRFYSELVDALCAAGIRPMVTLFHSDLPQWVFDAGGWNNEAVIEDFAFFAKTVTEELSDRVEYWFTMNEPQCFLPDYLELAGLEGDKTAQIAAWRTILLSHGRAVQAMRAAARKPLKIGLVVMGVVVEPVPGIISEETAEAMTFSDQGGFLGMARWTDPILRGSVSGDMAQILSPEDMEQICQPLDLFCANVYGSANFYDRPGRQNPLSTPGAPKSQIGMPVRPLCLYYMAKFAWHRYGLPILFTENGFSNIDFVMLDGNVHDPQRMDYIRRYLLALERTVEENIPVEGYLYWSILDNFEWFKGYDMRFGLVYVDYSTQERILKDSALYYREIIASNGRNLHSGGTTGPDRREDI